MLCSAGVLSFIDEERWKCRWLLKSSGAAYRLLCLLETPCTFDCHVELCGHLSWPWRRWWDLPSLTHLNPIFFILYTLLSLAFSIALGLIASKTNLKLGREGGGV